MKTFRSKPRFIAKPPARVQSMAKRYGTLEIAKNQQYKTYHIIGNTNVESTIGTTFNLRGQQLTMPEDGTIEKISIYLGAYTNDILLGIYADDGADKPSTLLGTTAKHTMNGVEGWIELDLVSGVSLSNNDIFWIAWTFEADSGVRYVDDPGVSLRSSSDVIGFADPLPDPYGLAGTAYYKFSIYASYTT